jgi:hypothetical protein
MAETIILVVIGAVFLTAGFVTFRLSICGRGMDEGLLVIGIVGTLALGVGGMLLFAQQGETTDTQVQSRAAAYLEQLGHTPKGAMLCTAMRLDLFSDGWSCSAATEPEGLVVTLHCGTRRCLVPVR